MLFCNICGYSHEHSLVAHVNEAHEGVAEYLSMFPRSRVVSKQLFMYLKNTPDTAGPASSQTQGSASAASPAAPVADTASPAAQSAMTITGVEITPKQGDSPNIPAVDPQYHFPKDATPDLVHAIQHTCNCYITGPTGTGKTSLVLQIAARMQYPVSRVNCSNQISVSDFVGRWVVEAGEMKYAYGILPRAMKDGHILLLDEITAADPGILLALQAVLESHGKLVLTEKDGEVIEPHADFRVIACDNTHGDDAGMNPLYQGRNAQDASLLDRFPVVIQLDYMDATAECNLLVNATGIAQKTARNIVKLARKVREACRKEELYTTFSTRKSLAFAHYLAKTGDLHRAAKVTVLNKLDAESRKVVEDILGLIFPKPETRSHS